MPNHSPARSRLPHPTGPSASTSLCLEFSSSAARAEPELLRRAADWLEAHPDTELLSVEVLPPWLIARQTFLRLMVQQERMDSDPSED